MPISFIRFKDGDSWTGATWVIEDENKLAKLIALVAMGQDLSVEKILRSTGNLPSDYPNNSFASARKFLTVESGNQTDHRDGWLFQTVSWIAAHLTNKESFIQAPQMIHADKGPDGLIVEFGDEKVASVVICEDKATKNPRKEIRSSVWPLFKKYETGDLNSSLISSVTSLLKGCPSLDPVKVVTNIFWDEQRAYRIAVTIHDKKYSDEDGRRKLFKNYETTVCGDIKRRRVEVVYFDDMRQRLANIADKAVKYIDNAEAEADV